MDAHLGSSLSLDPHFAHLSSHSSGGRLSGNYNPQEGTITLLTEVLDWQVGTPVSEDERRADILL